MNNKNKILTIVLIILIIGFVVEKINVNKTDVYEEQNKSSIKKNKNTLSMNLEQTAGAGDYKTVTQSEWPTEGYKFNEELSRCENGSTLSWDDTKKVVVVSGNLSDKCYVYFDIYSPPLTILEACDSGNSLASCITSLADKSESSITNIYHHDSSLSNGAGDNSYRYAGGDYQVTEKSMLSGFKYVLSAKSSSDGVINMYCNGLKVYDSTCSSTKYYTLQYDSTSKQYLTYKEALEVSITDGYVTKDNVKNFVCFGSDASICPEDNLYRIIGVFDGKVKLIKWDYANGNLLGTNGDYASSSSTDGYLQYDGFQTTIYNYYWNNKLETATNTWSLSELNTINLNTNFLNNIGTTWANKIATTTWKVGGNTEANIKDVLPATTYLNEITNPVITNTTDNATTYSAKIGLMYVSDYGFSAGPSAWTYNMNVYSSRIISSVNWMRSRINEWSITRYSDSDGYACTLQSNGSVWVQVVNNGYEMLSGYSIHPVFFLNPSVIYASGIGTQSDPIRLS